MPVDKNLLLFLKSAELGLGEPDLGARLMDSFLEMLWNSGRVPDKIICMNSGIFLTTEGSPVIETMKKFSAAGSVILSCGTCLDYFDRRDKLIIGEPTNMKDTVGTLLNYKQVLSP